MLRFGKHRNQNGLKGGGMAERILVVEDERITAQDIRIFLKKKKFEVETVPTGEQALEKIVSFQPSLVILDILLPGINGFEVLRQIRTFYPTLSVIMLTKLSDVEAEEQALELRADDYMMKSRGLKVLSRRIEAVLEARQNYDPNSDYLVCENLRVYPKSRKVFLGNREIEMRKQIFDLLFLLMQNAGIVVERERIFDYLDIQESEESEKLSRAVDRYISELRGCVAESPSDPLDKYVETISGVGYRFRRDK
jgi:DNA-binding response OmpR family regulator